MSAASSNGYRSEVIGSLLRPDYLKQAADRFQAGQLGEAELTDVQNRAVREAIKLQESCGIDVITDGDAYLQEALGLVRDLVRQLVASGVRYVQLDAPRYTHLCSEEGLANFHRLNINTDTWLGDMIALDNALMAGFPDVTFGLHLCRGNHRSMWSVEGGYDPIAEQLFNTLNVQRLLLEYDTPRAGTFEPLRFVPPDKTVVL